NPPRSAFPVRRDKAALFQWVQAPPGDSLQPEATGAGMEETKCLKPSDSGSRIGGEVERSRRARGQAVAAAGCGPTSAGAGGDAAAPCRTVELPHDGARRRGVA